MLKKLSRPFFIAGFGLLAASVAVAGTIGNNSTKSKRASRANAPLEIKIQPVGATQEQIDALKIRVERSEAVQSELRGANYRLISFQNLEQTSPSAPQFRIVFYDYTNERTLVAQGSFDAPEAVRVYEDAEKPRPSPEELEAAQAIIARDANFAAAIRSNRLRTFEAMPPISVDPNTGERLVNIGIESLDNSTSNEIVGVSFRREAVVRYGNNAPPTAISAAAACGIPSAGQGSTSQGTQGQYQMTVSQEGSPLWEMNIIRPAASSGANGSGIDLQNVKYKGKLVLKRAHAPVLNVQYVNNACGPYLDWQYAEGYFNAPANGATNPAPGIRLLASGQVATTALESGNDTGNFQGVAVYTQDVGFGMETVLVTEMNAGWYRYIMEWRFAPDGTIRPRYGFGATSNSCVCLVHTHHVYWRFDFDIVNPQNKIYLAEASRQLPNGKGLVPKKITQILTETPVARNYDKMRSLVIENPNGGEAYIITPNRTDGVADTYGGGDFWILKTAPNNGELGTTSGTAINLNPYLNNESVDNTDLLVWYGAHFIHADGSNSLSPDRSGKYVLSGSHVVGPDIKPVRW
jgi:hypothetical protein